MGPEMMNSIKDILAQNDVEFAGLFGSRARGEQTDQSDYDILVRFSRPKGLLDVIGLEQKLENRLHADVDLVTEGGLSPYIRDSVLRDLHIFYGAR
jgi:predicted nucleotidyltransferase